MYAKWGNPVTVCNSNGRPFIKNVVKLPYVLKQQLCKQLFHNFYMDIILKCSSP